MSILDAKVHAQLIADLDLVAKGAGIPKRFIERSMTEFCAEPEIEWFKGYRDHVEKGGYGLCFVGTDALVQMQALTGAFTRNFVLARLMSLGLVLDILREVGTIDASVLLIPSFQRPVKQAGLSAFQINLLWNLLEERMMQERQTVIAVQSISQLGSDYGPHFRAHVESHFAIVEAQS